MTTMDEAFDAMTVSLEREIVRRLAHYGIPADSTEAALVVPGWRQELENARDQILIAKFGAPAA